MSKKERDAYLMGLGHALGWIKYMRGLSSDMCKLAPAAEVTLHTLEIHLLAEKSRVERGEKPGGPTASVEEVHSNGMGRTARGAGL